jgi:hypothetical protein
MSSYNRQPVFPVLMVAAGVVLILGSIFWMMNAAPTEVGGPSTGAPQAARTVAPALEDVPTQGTARIPYSNVKRVSVADAKPAFDAKSAIFIDARGQQYFDSGHIPGAIPMTDQDLSARIGELDRNAWIITYCT